MKKILIIEDQHQIRENTAEILRIKGFEVVEAEDGKQGVTKAIFEKPDLILCDVMMPKMDGYEALEHIRKNLDTANIPFIFLTARVDKEDMRRGMNLGADDYITKPFTAKQLVEAINSRLERFYKIETEIQLKIDKLLEELNQVSSHEFYTPLNGILGFTALLKKYGSSMDKTKIDKIIDGIERSGNRLKHTIDNLLIYQQIIKKDYYPNNSQNRYPAIIEQSFVLDIVENLKLRHETERNVTITIEAAQLNIDFNDLHKIIEELLDNTFKFSPEESNIYISGTKKEEQYKLQICDNGYGFTPQQIESIAPFTQFERKRHAQQGNGLGLFIAKRLTEINGGQFIIESIKEKETIITLTF